MKKCFSIILSLICIFGCLSVRAGAEEVLNYTFENTDGLNVVTNTLADGGEALLEEGTLKLESNYGLDLGKVDDTFSVVAMVKVTTVGDFETVFFKNMGDKTNQKWTGFKLEKGVPTVWTNGDGNEWFKAVVADKAYTNQWIHVAYVEDKGTASLYIDGTLIGSGKVVEGEGQLYLGSTLWAGDAIGGNVDNLVLFDRALSEKEVQTEHEKNIGYYIHLPEIAINDIELINTVGTAEIVWKSSDESVVRTDGTLIRAEEDKVVTLSANVNDKAVAVFNVRVLKKSEDKNKDVILSYDFKENDNGVIRDKSGNGNDAVAHNGLNVGAEGALFDGKDDYVELTNGVIYGNDEITLVTTFKHETAQKHIALYTFGNTADTGYMFLNPSRPTTNALRFALTSTNGEKEKSIVSIPGIRNNQWATVVVVIKGSEAVMYVDGELVMDGDLGMNVSELGETKANYIAKSLYTADPYFMGTVSEFTIYSYAMSEDEIADRYKMPVMYDGSVAGQVHMSGESFAVETEAEKITITAKKSCCGGMLIVSCYDKEGKLLKVVNKVSDIEKDKVIEIEGSFDNTDIEVVYWGNCIE